MSGKSSALEAALKDAILRNDFTALDALGGANGYFGLHSGDPTDAGTQDNNELAYIGYARVSEARATCWTDAGPGTPDSNAVEVAWPTFTSGADVSATHWSYGTGASGATTILYSGALTSPVTIGLGNPNPKAPIGSLTIAES